MNVPLTSWAVLVAACLSGCATATTTAILTPTVGPLARFGARPIDARIEGITGDNGTLSFKLPSGERVAGEWATVHRDVSGTNRAATGHGNRGSIFDIEFECDDLARGIGKATDNHGNTYRILVRGI